jgi:drug/metabolite transporter (DMT)-like permease
MRATLSIRAVSYSLAQSAASLYIPAAVNSAMRAMLLVLTALLSRALRVRDGSAGGFEWAGIGISTLGATVIAANQASCGVATQHACNPTSMPTDLRGVVATVTARGRCGRRFAQSWSFRTCGFE